MTKLSEEVSFDPGGVQFVATASQHNMFDVRSYECSKYNTKGAVRVLFCVWLSDALSSERITKPYTLNLSKLYS